MRDALWFIAVVLFIVCCVWWLHERRVIAEGDS